MYPYTYKVTLRVFHPSIEPEVVTDALGMQPRRAWKVGDRRMTPTGHPLDGVNKESYWYSEFSPPDDGQLAEFLRKKMKALLQHRPFFDHIRETGGRVEFCVALFMGGGNMGETLPCDLLQAMGQLGVDLSLDIYEPENVESA